MRDLHSPVQVERRMTTITIQRFCCICGQDKCRFLYRTRLSPGPVVQCLYCGLVYINLVEHPEWLVAEDQSGTNDLIDASVPPVYQQLYLAEAPVKRMLYTEILSRIETANGRRGTLLDIGSYMGLFMQTAIGRGWRCKGVEPEREAWEYSVQKLGLDACWGTVSTCDLVPQSFDAVTLLQVLEHVESPREMLVQARNFLRPGGILIVEVPNIDCLSFKILGKRHRHFAKHHFTFFTPKTLADLIASCGFDVLDANFPKRVISFRLLDFGLSKWYPYIHKLISPLLRLPYIQNATLALNLQEVVSICARKP